MLQSITPFYFLVCVEVGKNKFEIIDDGITTYDEALKIKEEYSMTYKNIPFILASFNIEGDIHPNDYLEQKKREFLNRL